MIKPKFKYQEIVKTIMENKLYAERYFSDKDIFDYVKLPNEKLYEINFQFGQGVMEDHQNNYGISPSYYVFTNYTSVNAFATQINGSGLVGINMGLITFLIKHFHDNASILKLPKLELYGQTDFVPNYPLNELMYQTCTLFTLYHEVGHLMQGFDPSSNLCQEDLTGGAQFSIMQHFREHDADTYSAVCISTSIWQYFDKYYTDKSVTNFENLLGISSGGILCYLFSFPSKDKPLYLNQYSHPYPIKRILNIIDYISRYAVHLVKSKGINGFEPRKYNIIKIALEVGEELSASVLPRVPFQKFMGELMLYRDSVIGYINDLNRGVKSMERSAMRVRNNEAI